MEQNKYLMITSDDYGYSDTRDDGILECFKSGAITGAAAIVNGVSIESGVAKAKLCGMPLTLHLNLTEGHPVGSNYTTLTNKHGSLLGKMGFQEAISRNSISGQEIRDEIQSQIDRFTQLTNYKPPKVDGHQHAHVAPGVAEIYADVLHHNGIGMTRLPIETEAEDSARSEFLKTIVIQSMAASVTCQEKKIWSPNFAGLDTMGNNMTLPRLQQSVLKAFQRSSPTQEVSIAVSHRPASFREPPADQFCELMVHPGYKTGESGGCGDGPDDFSRSGDREHEMRILMSQDMKDFWAKQDIKLISFKDITFI
ncbi:carbohydrate deacetylase-like [Dreissena polymorpha]|uniref:carbohydrate deacetylase-like n=1 Tax=Dreissena polymorpha TaxID=45954 RepID=UPI0022644E9C|nr:carbohydrate deacetylase-like [Dreissena polymorpha]